MNGLNADWQMKEVATCRETVSLVSATATRVCSTASHPTPGSYSARGSLESSRGGHASMPAAPRPRRSTASASFAHLFQPIALDGDESSTDDGNSNVSKDGEEKKKKKRKSVYVPEEDSGSEFEVGEAGGKGADSDNEETSSEGSLEAASDDDDLGSGAGDSDVSGSVVGNSPPRKGKGKGGRKSGPSASAIVGNSKKGRAPVVASSSIITKGKNSDRPTTKDGPTRARIPASHPSSGISHMYEYFGPLAARGASRSLDLTSPDAGDDTVSAKASKRRRCLSEGRPTAGMNLLEDSIVDAMMDEATVNPFGVEAKSVRDASWHPGQWDILAGKERSRWGGWYPEVTVPRDTLETLSDEYVVIKALCSMFGSLILVLTGISAKRTCTFPRKHTRCVRMRSTGLSARTKTSMELKNLPTWPMTTTWNFRSCRPIFKSLRRIPASQSRALPGRASALQDSYQEPVASGSSSDVSKRPRSSRKGQRLSCRAFRRSDSVRPSRILWGEVDPS